MQLRKQGPWSKHTRLHERRLAFERFENRQLMAVTTSLDQGTLTITGDEAADDIAIVGTARAGELVVTGRNGTLIDGVPNGRATAYPVHVASPNLFVQAVALNINTAGGNDKISIDNAIIGGSLSVTMGDGDDYLLLGQTGAVIVGGDCFIRTGAGNDRFSEGNYSVSSTGGQAVSLEDGNDTASLMGWRRTRLDPRDAPQDSPLSKSCWRHRREQPCSSIFLGNVSRGDRKLRPGYLQFPGR
jgi:hypothetical protein